MTCSVFIFHYTCQLRCEFAFCSCIQCVTPFLDAFSTVFWRLRSLLSEFSEFPVPYSSAYLDAGLSRLYAIALPSRSCVALG